MDRSICKVTLLCLLAVTQTGCLSVSALMGRKKSPTLDTSYLKAAGYSIPPGGMPAPVAPTANNGRAIILEVRTGEKPHIEQIRLASEQPMFVENLVRDAKLHERLGGMNITVLRPAGANMPPVRMDVQVSDEGKIMKVEQNYALMPGDHVIVNHDERTSLEVWVDRVIKGNI